MAVLQGWFQRLRGRPQETEVVAADGRRRRRLLGLENEPDATLSMADVEALRSQRTPEARAALAEKLGRLHATIVAEDSRRLAEAVLDQLSRDGAIEVRKRLAEAIGENRDVPPSLVQCLAGDGVEVARAVLERSPLLEDSQLIELVHRGTAGHAAAVAGRAEVSEGLSEAVVATGDAAAIKRLLSNTGAHIGIASLRRIAAGHPGDRLVQERLMRRPGLPHDVVIELMNGLARRLEWPLADGWRIALEEAQKVLAMVREEGRLNGVTREHGDRAHERLLRDQHMAGALDHETVLRFFKEADVTSLEIGLAVHSGLERDRVKRLLRHKDRRRLAALGVRAGFPTPHYLLLRSTVELAEDTVGSGWQQIDLAERLGRFREEYEKLRGDPRAVEELLRLPASIG